MNVKYSKAPSYMYNRELKQERIERELGFKKQVEQLLEKIDDVQNEFKKVVNKTSKLSARERQMLKYIVISATNKKIKDKKEQEKQCQDLKKSETE